MNDRSIKEIWNNKLSGNTSRYKETSIESFFSKRSGSVAQKIKNLIIMDIILKGLVLIAFGIDLLLYSKMSNIVVVCSAGILVLALLILFQLRMLKRFTFVVSYNQSARDKLASMLTYLKSRFLTTLLASSITYLFVFVAGTLIYFYIAYGYVRPLDTKDIVVFTLFILIGIGFNFFANKAQVNYQVKHLETCLSDLNDQALAIVSDSIEFQQKQDRTNKLLLMFVMVLGLVLLLLVFKNFNFIIQ